MATTTCPDGHDSEATDWCDECGIAMAGAGAGGGASSSASTPLGGVGDPALGECPNCATIRVEGEAFCEVCGLDFLTGRLPAAPVAVPAPAPEEQAGEPAATTAAASGWSVVVTTDREWFDRNEAESGRTVEFPEAARPRTVDLVGDVVTIGRRDDGRGWFPDIDLGVPVLDPSTSRRHAELRRKGEGWVLLDVGSTNGTSLAGEKLTAQEEQALQDGAVIHLGAFTRLVVHAPVVEA